MGFSQALSGLNAAAQSLEVLGNNIANSATVGFKGSSAQFADIFAGAQAGFGTRVVGRLQDFTTGAIEFTGRDLDLAISGSGFFRFLQGDQVVYSRNGQLIVTKDGYLENAQGARLTGFPSEVGTRGSPVALRIPAASMVAAPTTRVQAVFNLHAGSPALAPADFDPTNPDTYSYANAATVYDSLGVQHTLTLYFVKIADNQWQVHGALDGVGAADVGEIAFDGSGNIDELASANVSPLFAFAPGRGADPLSIELDLTGTSQLGNDFALDAVAQDGYRAGSLIGISIDEQGNVVGTYSNEQKSVLGTIAIAEFRSPENLRPAGDNVWLETAASGQPLIGLAGTGRLGTVQGGALEASNIDLTRELVELIIAQRNFQANAQSIKVQDDIMQSAVNLR